MDESTDQRTCTTVKKFAVRE